MRDNNAIRMPLWFSWFDIVNVFIYRKHIFTGFYNDVFGEFGVFFSYNYSRKYKKCLCIGQLKIVSSLVALQLIFYCLLYGYSCLSRPYTIEFHGLISKNKCKKIFLHKISRFFQQNSNFICVNDWFSKSFAYYFEICYWKAPKSTKSKKGNS